MKVYLMGNFLTHTFRVIRERKAIVLAVILSASGIGYVWYEKHNIATLDVPQFEPTPVQFSTTPWQGVEGSGLEDWQGVLTARVGTSTHSNIEDLTVTELAAREFFARFIELEQHGMLTEQSMAQLADGFTQNIIGNTVVTIKVPTHQTSDLSTVSATAESRKRYGNAIGNIILEQGEVGTNELEMQIALRALEKDNPKILTEIDPFVSAYDNMIREFLRVPVPEDAVSVHLDTLHSFENMKMNALLLKKTFSDPISAGVALQRYRDIYIDYLTAFESAHKYFRRNNITFRPNESGHLYANLVTEATMANAEIFQVEDPGGDTPTETGGIPAGMQNIFNF